MFCSNDLFFILPEIFLLFLICFFLLDGFLINTNPVYLHKYQLKLTFRYNLYISFLIFYSLIILAAIYLFLPDYNFILNQFNFISSFGIVACKLFVLFLFTIFFCFFDKKQLIRFYEVEFFVLFYFILFGLLSLLSSFDWLLIFLSIEIYSLACYVLVSIKKNSNFSTEAGLKYFILGSFSSGLLLFGISFLYGSTGTLNLAELQLLVNSSLFVNVPSYNLFLLGLFFITAAFLFKLAAAPFHFWAIDVYDGAPLIVTAFLSLIPKFAIFYFFGTFFQSCIAFSSLWVNFLLISAILSFIFGTFGAIFQPLIKRMFIYSMIVNSGFLIAALSTNSFFGFFSWIFFLILYSLTIFSLFSFMLSFRSALSFNLFRNLNTLSGFFSYNSFWAITVTFLLFSLAGVPPMAGFFGKFFILLSVAYSNSFILAFFIIFASLVGLFYYLRIIKLLCFDPEQTPKFLIIPSTSSLLICSSFLFFLIMFFIWGEPLLYFVHNLVLFLLI